MKKQKIDYFKQFSERCLYWQKIFGLNGWDFYFHHSNMDSDIDAKVRCNHTAKQVNIKMNKNYKPDFDELNKTAFEEVCHVLLADLVDRASACSNQNIVTEAGHTVVFHLWNMIERIEAKSGKNRI